MKILMYWVNGKFWFVPALYSLSAAVLSIALFYVDLYWIEQLKPFLPSVVLTNVDLAKTIMGSLSGALLTMTTFTFSTILVVLTMYSSQFSPRTLENFVKDRLTWRVLGIFLGGFVYNTLSLMFMREHLYSHDVLSTFVGIMIAFCCLAAFAYFIHYIAMNVQVGTLVDSLEKDTEAVIKKYEKLQEERCSFSEWKPAGVLETVTADKSGFIQFFSLKELADYAGEEELEAEILVTIGEYIYEGKPVMRIYRKSGQQEKMERFYSTGQQRTSEQDLDYALQKLIEVALRAISPGINDPNTANEIILRIGRLLGKMGQLKTGSWILTDQAGQNRLLYRFPSYEEILYSTFYQLSHYGKEDVSVMSAMIAALRAAAEGGPARHHTSLWNTLLYFLEGISESEFKRLDREKLQREIDALAAAVGKRSMNLRSWEPER